MVHLSATHRPMQLPTITLITNNESLPGTDEIRDIVEMGQAGEFCNQMAVRAISRVWTICDARKELRSYRELYTGALGALGAELPTWPSY